MNEVYIRVTSEDRGIEREIWEFFSFKSENKHDPRIKNKVWDGIIHLYNFKTKQLYYGLLDHVRKFCKDRSYRIVLHFDDSKNACSIFEIEEFLKTLKLPDKIQVRDYQLATIAHAIRDKRMVGLSAVNSGKSLSIYSIIRYLNRKTLLIVPSKSLVTQMFNDFADYSQSDDSWDVVLRCSKVTGETSDKSKSNMNQIVISTWQSINAMANMTDWLEDFEVVIVDEAHEAKAKSIKTILETLPDTEYRFGFTGTLDDIPINELVLVGLFGPVKEFIRTREMIERKFSSDLTIKTIVFNHPEQTRKRLSEKKYRDYKTEVDYLISNEERNDFIINLAFSLKGNVLIFYNYVDKHGKILYDKALERNHDDEKLIQFVYGEVTTEERELIRQNMELNNNVINIASYGTYRRGINITNIDYLIFAFSFGSKTLNLQSIGRGLRRGENNTHVTLFDLGDDISYKGRTNHTLRHLAKRLKIYMKEGFTYKVYKVKIKNG